MKGLIIPTKPNVSYLSVLFWFIALFIFSPLFTQIHGRILLTVAFSLIMISILLSLHVKKASTILGYFIIVPALIFDWWALYDPNMWVEFLSSIFSALFLLLMILVLLKSVFLSDEIDLNVIYGSICIYIMLGFFFAFVYNGIELISLDSFRGLLVKGEFGTHIQEFLYYSYVTQTTLGYGDIVPISYLARNIATLQAIGGQFYLAILVAGLIGLHLRGK